MVNLPAGWSYLAETKFMNIYRVAQDDPSGDLSIQSRLQIKLVNSYTSLFLSREKVFSRKLSPSIRKYNDVFTHSGLSAE
jgi:hypothetical protein